MNNLKRMIAIAGLAALISGCDDNSGEVLATCRNDNLKVRVVQHHVPYDLDKLSFEFYKISEDDTGDQHIGTIPDLIHPDKFQFQCDNGMTLKITDNYFFLDQPYFIESKK